MIPGLLDDLLGVQLFGYITFRVAREGAPFLAQLHRPGDEP